MPIYSYAELKGKIKVGDRVKLLDMLTDAARLCERLVSRVEDKGFHTDDNSYFHRWTRDGVVELLTEEKTLDTVDVGDVVVDGDGRERTILDTSKNGTVLFLSSAASGDWSGVMTTRQELKLFDYTVKQSTPLPEPKEMTLEEVSKALGYPVKIVE